jgi:hypothetical protein
VKFSVEHDAVIAPSRRRRGPGIGGFVTGVGALIGGAGGFLLTARPGWLRAGVAFGVTLAFSQFLASNVRLRSDFLWFVGSLFVLAIVASACVIRSRQGGLWK